MIPLLALSLLFPLTTSPELIGVDFGVANAETVAVSARGYDPALCIIAPWLPICR